MMKKITKSLGRVEIFSLVVFTSLSELPQEMVEVVFIMKKSTGDFGNKSI